MDNLPAWLVGLIVGGSSAAFVAISKYTADKYLKRIDYGREDRRAAAEADRGRAQIESARIDSIFESHRKLAESLEARIRQQDEEISKLRREHWELWQKSDQSMKAAAECERANSILQQEKNALARRVTALELRLGELGNKINSDGGS